MSKVLVWLMTVALFLFLAIVLIQPPITTSLSGATQHQTSVLAAPIEYLRGQFLSDIELLSYQSVAESGSIVFLLLSAFFSATLYLIQESSWLLVFNWFWGVSAFNWGRKRQAKNTFTIKSSVTGKPVCGAEVAVLHGGTVAAVYHSDAYGRVLFNSPMEGQKVKLRISRIGYRSEIVMLDAKIADIPLEPLVHGLSFHMAHTLKVAQTTALLVGTLLFASIVLQQTNGLVLLTLVGYLFLWINYLRSSIQPFHLVQVIDRQTRQPIAHAKVITCNNDSIHHLLSDDNGFLRVPYPIPERIMAAKRGYTSATQTIPMTAISSDILIVTMQTAEK